MTTKSEFEKNLPPGWSTLEAKTEWPRGHVINVGYCPEGHIHLLIGKYRDPENPPRGSIACNSDDIEIIAEIGMDIEAAARLVKKIDRTIDQSLQDLA